MWQMCWRAHEEGPQGHRSKVYERARKDLECSGVWGVRVVSRQAAWNDGGSLGPVVIWCPLAFQCRWIVSPTWRLHVSVGIFRRNFLIDEEEDLKVAIELEGGGSYGLWNESLSGVNRWGGCELLAETMYSFTKGPEVLGHSPTADNPPSRRSPPYPGHLKTGEFQL